MDGRIQLIDGLQQPIGQRRHSGVPIAECSLQDAMKQQRLLVAHEAVMERQIEIGNVDRQPEQIRCDHGDWSQRRMIPVRCAMVAVALLSPLLAGCDSVWGWAAQPFRLSCSLDSGSPTILRIDPRTQQVQYLDPKTGEVTRTITTNDPPPELGGGIIDDSRVTITPRQVSWETSMYRPHWARDSHWIDLSTLRYTSESVVQIEMGPEMGKQKRTGRCRRI